MAQVGAALGRGLGLSELAPRVVQSEIRAMTQECDRLGGVNLAQGVCDTEVPEVVAEGAIRAIRDGLNIYTRMDGIARLRHAIAAKAERTLGTSSGFRVDPEREVLVTNGVTGAFQAAVMALLNPGDEVLLFEPFYGYHASTLKSIRAVPVPVGLTAPDWGLDLEAVRAAITPKTRGMVINTPSNPAGKVFTRKELEGLAAIAEEFDLFVFTDEIYEHFIYGGCEAYQSRYASGDARADDSDVGIFEDVLGDGMESGISDCRCEMGGVDWVFSRPDVCVCAGSAAAGMRGWSGEAGG